MTDSVEYPGSARNEMTVRDRLAVDRTLLAHERTFLAYTQSALAMLGGGLALIHLGGSHWVNILGYVLLPVSPLFFILGLVKQGRRRRLRARFGRKGMSWTE